MKPLMLMLLAILLAVVLIRLVSHPIQVQKIRHLIQSGALDTGHAYVSDVRRVAVDSVSNTKDTIEISVNTKPRHDSINIYVLDSAEMSDAAKEAFHWAVGELAYIGNPNLIVIDVEAIRVLLGRYRHQLARYYDNTRWEADEVLQSWMATLVRWVVAHEIGHALLGHEPSNFSPSNGLLVEYTIERLSHRQELAADVFAMESVPESQALEVENVLIALLNAEFERVNGPVELHLVGLHIVGDIEYLQHGSHPDFVYRILRALEVRARENESLRALIRPGLDALRYPD